MTATRYQTFRNRSREAKVGGPEHLPSNQPPIILCVVPNIPWLMAELAYIHVKAPNKLPQLPKDHLTFRSSRTELVALTTPDRSNGRSAIAKQQLLSKHREKLLHEIQKKNQHNDCSTTGEDKLVHGPMDRNWSI
jgi:hypothetical protein|uniref:Uncharacterized protein n=1 Tax=Eutreptiella gymnastica TaxID=73025 RepID=A0A6T2D0W0_9EUGL|mmetsp:Transcript_18596/g.32347  ORF Transcript_18596/g.32347 Transcript_18596/m.32347 type:complete len:135 (+) Transcript_18596:318-722(+)